MYHSLLFGDEITFDETDGMQLTSEKNTWDDWHLIPSSRPVISPPSVRKSAVTIPGAHGSLDTTTLLTGYPLFENRSGSLEFYVDQGYWDWTTAYMTIMSYLHGRVRKMILEDDPSWYYEGRFSVNQWKSNKDFSTITINYDLYPFKRYVYSTDDDWEWDPFNFETGMAVDSGVKIAKTKTYTFTIEGGMVPQKLKMRFTSTGTGNASVICNGVTNTVAINAGEVSIPVTIQNGRNDIVVKNNGTAETTVSIIFRREEF